MNIKIIWTYRDQVLICELAEVRNIHYLPHSGQMVARSDLDMEDKAE
jgi:hypothetical protein